MPAETIQALLEAALQPLIDRGTWLCEQDCRAADVGFLVWRFPTLREFLKIQDWLQI
jgi:glutathione S-transferase